MAEKNLTVSALAVFECLDIQRLLIGKEEYFIEDQNGHTNGKALGSVFGFLDACLQAKRLNIRDEEGLPTVLHLLANLAELRGPEPS